MFRTRFAPTPSGYLHLGNLLNLSLTKTIATTQHGEFGLRLDVWDSERIRVEYLSSVFEALNWLEIKPTFGPRNLSEIEAETTTKIVAETRRLLPQLLQMPAVFVCECSRTQLAAGRCVRACIDKKLDLSPNAAVLRIATDSTDEVLWRRDDIPSYHLASCYEDAVLEITHVVRGQDLAESSKLHEELNTVLGLPSIKYVHHPLLTDSTGIKLSKSQHAEGAVYNEQNKALLDRLTEKFLPELLEQLR